MRGVYLLGINGYSYVFSYWYLTFDGKELSAFAAKELFIDDTPGHVMNPDEKGNPKTGLFPRDYVFKQFNTSKTNFRVFLEIWPGGTCYESGAFDPSSIDYQYTGGDFPELIKL